MRWIGCKLYREKFIKSKIKKYNEINQNKIDPRWFWRRWGIFIALALRAIPRNGFFAPFPYKAPRPSRSRTPVTLLAPPPTVFFLKNFHVPPNSYPRYFYFVFLSLLNYTAVSLLLHPSATRGSTQIIRSLLFTYRFSFLFSPCLSASKKSNLFFFPKQLQEFGTEGKFYFYYVKLA